MKALLTTVAASTAAVAVAVLERDGENLLLIATANHLTVHAHSSSLQTSLPLFGSVFAMAVITIHKKQHILMTSNSGFLSILELVSNDINNASNTRMRIEITANIHLFDHDRDSMHMQPGTAISVDPLCRAVLVSAHQSAMKLFLVNDQQSQVVFDAISNKHSVWIQEHQTGLWDTLFLTPELHRRNVILFAAIIFRDAAFSVILFDHEINPTSESAPQVTRHGPFPLPRNFTPVKSIALRNTPNTFLIISETLDVVIAKVVEHDAAFEMAIEFQYSLVESFPLESEQSCAPLVCSIIPCPDDSSEAFYIASDAGHLIRLDIYNSETIGWSCATTPISRRKPITHMAVVASKVGRSVNSNLCEDTLAILGDMCDGEFVTVNYAHSKLSHKSNIPNRAPVLDFKLTDTYRPNKLQPQVGGDALYLTSGYVPNGRIQEMRLGVGAAIEAESGGDEFEGVTGIWNVKTAARNSFDTFLGVSLLSSTRLFHLLDDTLEDVSISSGLNLDEASVLIAGIDVEGEEVDEGVVAQVWKGGVVVSRPQYFDMSVPYSTSWKPRNASDSIFHASAYKDMICVTLSESKTVQILRVVASPHSFSIIELTSVALPHEPSCIFWRDGMCTVGTYEPGFMVLELDEMNTLQLLSRTSLSKNPARLGRTHGVSVPHSIQFIDDSILVLGMRDGSILAYSLQDLINVKLLRDLQIGNHPVTLVQMPNTQSSVLAVSDKVWKVTLTSSSATIDPTLMENVQSATPFTHVATPPQTTFIMSTPTKILFTSLDSVSRATTLSFNVTRTPRRVIYDATTGCLIVACNTRKTSDSTALTGEIKLICPKTGTQHLREWLPEGEAVYSLTIWNIKDQKRYVCVGTGGYKESVGSPSIGRVLVYSLKASDRSKSQSGRASYRIKQLGEYKVDELVFSVCSFMRSYLLAASGCKLYQLKIESESRTLHCGAQTELRYPIRSLSVCGSQLYVGGSNDSISMFVFDPRTKRFTFCSSDDISRSPSDCISLSDTHVLVADKSGELYCLQDPGSTTKDLTTNHRSLCLKTSFCAHLGQVVLRLHTGQMDSGFHRFRELGVVSLLGASEEEDEEDGYRARGCKVVYACSVVGGVFAVRGLTEEAYVGLKALQDVLAGYEKTRPRLGNSHAKFRSTEHHASRNVIDGDLVKEFMKLSPAEKGHVQQEWFDRLGVKNGANRVAWMLEMMDFLDRAG
ncbi:mono-functional DNA-alkylating methyl methanesulfonate N-term-domain-containing protein [Chytriomyces cf. hyalinus JEL632]|nr:mono-functional DNA-alkylating methyl methanesulfonate N-term-domain-containing protein [Chytriomyces cf. hyalinus JEL632]